MKRSMRATPDLYHNRLSSHEASAAEKMVVIYLAPMLSYLPHVNLNANIFLLLTFSFVLASAIFSNSHSR